MNHAKTVLVTGGCGYKGSVLVPKLRQFGHKVNVVDNCWFGTNLPIGLPVWKTDVRDFSGPFNCDAIIHLANIANDPCGELDSKLTWEVNALATVTLVERAIKAGVKQFIYASSASVYGIKDNKPVNEDTDLCPVSDYNKTKMVAERILKSYANKINIQIVRPATICGFSPRMRLDVVVNALTVSALVDGFIEVKTPDLYRPHCHIEDCADLYLWLLDRPDLHGPYNAGFENQTIMQTAQLIAEYVGCEVRVAPHIPGPYDKRSYLVDSSRILATGFKPRFGVKDAIKDIVDAYRAGKFKDEEKHYNLAHMKRNGWVAA